MYGRHFSFFSLILILTFVLLLLGACTRERPTWTPTDTVLTEVGGTALNTLTPDNPSTSVPIRTPHVTAPVGDNANPVVTVTPSINDLQPGQTAPNSDLPPLPGEKDLTPKPPTPTPELETFIHIVQPGQSLSGIAETYDVEAELIVAINFITDPGSIVVGQKLLIPGEPPEGAYTGQGYVHVVKAGETLFGIAQEYGIPLNELAETNNITNPAEMRTGLRLIIPNVAESQAQPSEVRAHVVQAGETLSSIAAQYGVTPADIMKLNNMDNPNRVYSGQKLIIPPK